MDEQPRRSFLPRRLALGPAVALFALLAAGCYRSHDGPGPDGGRCGDAVCAPDEECCVFGCEGRARCVRSGPFSRCPPDDEHVPIGGCCTRDAECAPHAVCRFAVGSCGTGTCVERSPTPSCEGECTYVCGCDGRTYCNECEARDAGTTLRNEGPCECGPGRDPCRRGQYCLHAPGACGADGVPGACVDRPTCPGMGPGDVCACPHEDESPVCSCDGRVDESADCAAARAQSLATPDRCWDRRPEMLCVALCGFLVETCGTAPSTGCLSECLDSLESCTRDDAARAWACIEPGDCALGAACISELPCASRWPGMP